MTNPAFCGKLLGWKGDVAMKEEGYGRHLVERIFYLLELMKSDQVEIDRVIEDRGQTGPLSPDSVRELQTALELLDLLPGGVLFYYAGGSEEIICANRGMLRIFQCSTIQEFRAFTGNSFRGVVYPEDLEEVEAQIQSQIASGQEELDHVEYRIVRKDGSTRWIEDYGRLLHSEVLGDVFCAFLGDATERRSRQLAENAAIANEMEIIEGLSINYETICYVDLEKDQVIPYRLSCRTDIFFDGLFQVRRYSRYAADYIAAWVHPEDRELVAKSISPDYIREKLAEGKTYYFNYRVIVKGELQYLQLRLVKVGQEAPVSRLVLGYRRVDEEIRKEMEQKLLLAEALEKANLAVSAKNTFLSNISHDMRTPLNAIFGFTSLAKSSLSDPGALREHLEQLEVASRELLHMITQVLEISALSTAAGPAEVECDICEIVQEAYDFLLPQAKEKAIDFSFQSGQVRHSGIYADQDKLRQLVLSLANNAVTYTKPGGRVTITLLEGDELPDHYAAYRLVVEDTGIGISESFLARIFEPFSREKNSTLSGVHGIGLGLTIAKGIVDKMGGSIEVQSAVNEGSTFTVSLCFRVQSLPNAAEETAAAVLQPSRRILLVEDNEINREIETELLENMGFIIDSAEDGKIALEKVAGAAPGDYDLVIMDLQMPVMDGWESSAAIRRLPDPTLARIPIVALSANSLDNDRRKSRESGIDVHLAKPLNLPQLLDTIEELMKVRGRR